MPLLEDTIRLIEPPDSSAAKLAAARLDSLTKPPGSLGLLEEIVRRYAAIRRDSRAAVGRGALAVFVADHGVADLAVSAFPQSVTLEMLKNIAGGGAAISVLARRFGYELHVVDVGVRADTSAAPLTGVLYRRIGPGTADFTREPAMSPDQTRRALEVGIELARQLALNGVTLLGIGEMGIANSTSAAALLSVYTGIAPDRLVGRGTGVDGAGLARKLAAIEKGIEIHAQVASDPLATLAALGGFEIAAMAGACLGGAASHVPVVVDGFIASAAAAAAMALCADVGGSLFFSHRSAEGGHALVLEAMKARPLLALDMRLGEGTGAALAMSLIDAALELFHRMATFASAGVSGKVR